MSASPAPLQNIYYERVSPVAHSALSVRELPGTQLTPEESSNSAIMLYLPKRDHHSPRNAQIRGLRLHL
jgi:hypothetical protein